MIAVATSAGTRNAALAVIAAGLLAIASPAGAGGDTDLGGGCCADLDERVAELEASTARKGNRKVSLVISGQVNRSVLWYDDGHKSDALSVDNTLANTRLRFTGTARIRPTLTAGFHIEIDLNTGSRLHQVNQIDDDGASAPLTALGDGLGAGGDALPGMTVAHWWIEHATYGKVTVGRLYTSSSAAGTMDLGGIGVLANAQPLVWGGGFLLRNGANALSTNDTWGSLSCGADAGFGGPYSFDCGYHSMSRRDGVRYDTPTWHGFTASASWGENDFWDAALRYAQEHQDLRVAAALGYRFYRDREPDAVAFSGGVPVGPLWDSERRMWIGSASILHTPTGLFLNGAYLQYQYRGSNPGEIINGTLLNRPDTTLWHLAGGIRNNWFGIGALALYAELGRVKDGVTGLAADTAFTGLGATGTVIDSEMRWWGLGVVQNIDSAYMEVYLGYRHYEASATTDGAQITGGLKDIDFVQAGARIQF
jgi:hypothetical protein